jgi:hypothetical protein
VLWERWKKELEDKLPADGPAFRDTGISHMSLLSPPPLVWDLLVPTTPRNTPVCEFHTLAEGHANVFCEDGMGLFSQTMIVALERAWYDKSIWHVTSGDIPRFPPAKLADMTGIEKEVVGKHADVLLYRFFKNEVDESSMGAYFRQGVREQLGCRLLGIEYVERKGAGRKAWEDMVESHGGVPWRKFYTEYVCPLSIMMRDATCVYQTCDRIAEDGELERGICRYINGAIMVFGEQFWSKKSKLHYVRHLPMQMRSECNS